jgi:hypothetical protein
MAFTKIDTHGVKNIPQEYFCEEADVATLPIVDGNGSAIPVGSTCWVLDEKYGLTFDGSSWREV